MSSRWYIGRFYLNLKAEIMQNQIANSKKTGVRIAVNTSTVCPWFVSVRRLRQLQLGEWNVDKMFRVSRQCKGCLHEGAEQV